MNYSVYNTKYGKFLLDNNDNISKHLIDDEFWEPELLAVFESLPKDSTIVEIGSYLGDHTVYLSKIFKKVYTFEGYKRNYYQLLANLFLNDCYNVTTYNYIMGNGETVRSATKEDKWELDFENNASGARFVNGEGHPTIKLDHIILDPFQLLKIDAEGMDLSIMKGAKGKIKAHQPTIIFEHNVYISPPIEEYFIFLDSINYYCDRIGEYNWLAKPKG